MRCLLLISFVFSNIFHIEGYSWGLQRTACEFFTPSHIGRNRRPPDNYYQLSSKKVMFSPGEEVRIKVIGSSRSNRYEYTGLLMSVRKDGESFGTWETSYDFHHVDCSNKLGSAIAEANQFPKIVGTDVFKWTAPDECEIDQIYYVTATVVKTKREFLDNLTLPLKCVEPSKDRRHDSCTRKFHAIPDGAATSFEPTNPGGWTNHKRAQLQWRLLNGSTPSPGTGPTAAHHGNYYMYVETSFPATKGQKAILVSPPGLAGCLCFEFAYHMYTDPEAKFYCTVNNRPVQCQHPNMIGEDEGTVPMDTKRDKWIKSWLSINESGNVEIQIIAQRGKSFRGDIGLDDFIFTPGGCLEDQKFEF